MTVTPKSAISSLMLRKYIRPIIVLCSTVCLMSSVVHAQGLTADNFTLTKPTTGWAPGATAVDSTPRLQLSMAEHSSFSPLVTPPHESRQSSTTPSGLLISMIDREAYSATTRSKSVSAQSANLDSSVSFDLYKAIVRDQKNSRPGYLSLTDLRAIVLNPSDRNLFSWSASFGAEEPTSGEQPGPQFKPLAQIHLGDYGLPILLHVTNAQECCR